LEEAMKNLSPLEAIATCIIAINLFAINLFVIIYSFIEARSEQDFLIDFTLFPRKSQLLTILEEDVVKVAIQDNNAYWVVDNVLYKAIIDEYGNINNENAEEVDVFNLSEKEVDNLALIVDNINL
jgi:hypothetical protein